METPNLTCIKCKCDWKPDENDINTFTKLPFKTCSKCREKGRKWAKLPAEEKERLKSEGAKARKMERDKNKVIETPILDCTYCKSKWTPEENDRTTAGKYYKRCKKCRERLMKWKEEMDNERAIAYDGW